MIEIVDFAELLVVQLEKRLDDLLERHATTRLDPFLIRRCEPVGKFVARCLLLESDEPAHQALLLPRAAVFID